MKNSHCVPTLISTGGVSVPCPEMILGRVRKTSKMAFKLWRQHSATHSTNEIHWHWRARVHWQHVFSIFGTCNTQAISWAELIEQQRCIMGHILHVHTFMCTKATLWEVSVCVSVSVLWRWSVRVNGSSTDCSRDKDKYIYVPLLNSLHWWPLPHSVLPKPESRDD